MMPKIAVPRMRYARWRPLRSTPPARLLGRDVAYADLGRGRGEGEGRVTRFVDQNSKQTASVVVMHDDIVEVCVEDGWVKYEPVLPQHATHHILNGGFVSRDCVPQSELHSPPPAYNAGLS